jgi:hypothetical protein
MRIDLTKSGGATLEEVRKLLASKDDTINRQLRVDGQGFAFLSDEVGAENIGGLKFRFETWAAGNGYCGLKAADDDAYLASVRDDLNSNWPDPKASYIDW